MRDHTREFLSIAKTRIKLINFAIFQYILCNFYSAHFLHFENSTELLRAYMFYIKSYFERRIARAISELNLTRLSQIDEGGENLLRI